ncbi:MAG TPA: apolipoprotein N-acyltransferase [Fimbriimonadaceae bacterium]|nr:apolipoprotein N-acyltransferase [Fimbriimonadaceae bacterium]
MKVWESARRALPIFGSVVLLSLAFPPANVSLLVLVALAPWFASLRDTDARGSKKSGYLFGFLYFLFQMFWLVPFVSHWTGSIALAVVPWVVAAAAAGFYYMLAGWLVYRCWQRKALWAIPLVWSGVEAFRSYIIGLAFPWGLVAFPLWRYPAVVQHAAFGTIFFVSATVVFINVLVACVIWPKEGMLTQRAGFQSGIFLLILLMYSLLRYNSTNAGPDKKVYTVGQTGVDVAFGNPKDVERNLQTAVDTLMGAASLNKSSVLILPEGVAMASVSVPPEGPVHPVDGLAVVFGGNRVEGDDTFQTAYAYDGTWKWADKTRLVIFGEYVPLRDTLPFLQDFDLPSGDLTPAKKLKTLEVDGVKTGTLLCFEGLFPDLAERHCRNGAQVLAVMSIDDWYQGTPAPEQLSGSSVWRSIESGLPVLRSASLGTSLVTDCRGRVPIMAPVGKTVPLRVEVSVPAKSDAFDYRFGFV